MEHRQRSNTLTLCIVGHTNTGKTSLVRTLLRDANFGNVDNASGTTRHVESVTISSSGEVIIELRDTPGLEDSNALFDAINALKTGIASGRKALNQFVHDSKYAIEFEQELKVLKQILICDAMLYVIDCREAVLEKYLFELKCLSFAARPIIPILNFINASHNNKSQWRETLANLNLHTVIEFDTVAFDFDAEKRLYQKLQTVLEQHHEKLDSLMSEHASQWQSLKSACYKVAAKSLVQVAHTVVTVKKGESVQTASESLQNQIRLKEHACLKHLLELMQFSKNDVNLINLPVTNNHWNSDLFAPETLKHFGIDTASAAATGAAVGAGIDVVLAGISLGAATALGAAIGVSWTTTKKYGRNLLGQLRGEQYLCLDTNTLKLIVARHIFLLETLFQRGHAAQTKISLNQTETKLHSKKYDTIVKQLKTLQNTVASNNPSHLKNTQREVLQQLTWFSSH